MNIEGPQHDVFADCASLQVFKCDARARDCKTLVPCHAVVCGPLASSNEVSLGGSG